MATMPEHALVVQSGSSILRDVHAALAARAVD